MTPDEYCQQKAVQSGSSFYYSFLFLPSNKKRAMTALYAFCRQVDDIVDDLKDPDVAHTQLKWWFSEIDRLFHGTPQHPITLALAPFIEQFHWEQRWFEEILQGMQMDLMSTQYATFDDLKVYCYHVAGVVGILSAHVFGFKDPKTILYAKNLGIALQLVNIIRDLGEDLHRGRMYLPQSDLAQFGINPEELLDKKESAALSQLLHFQAKRARQYYQDALAVLPAVDRANQKSGIIMAKVYFTLLDEMAHDNFQVLHQRYSLTPIRKFWIAWRTHQQEKISSYKQRFLMNE
jgi:phytoene synthase